MITTIQLNKETKEKLDKFKIHDRESYNELILRLIENDFGSLNSANKESLIETIEILSDAETMRGISEALSEEGGISLEDLEKELDL